MAKYFAQRAQAGLIVTDCTAVSEQGKGVINGPGIWRDDQVQGCPPIANTGFDRDRGTAAVASGEVDAIAYGTLYIANPDLVVRFEANAGLNEADPSTFYGSGPRGYTDYPTLEEA